MLFVDYIMMLAYTPDSLQLMINQLSDYYKLWSLLVNLDKSKLIVFKKEGRPCSKKKCFYNGQSIEKLHMETDLQEKLYLPPNSPNYILMLKSGLPPLFIKTLKL